MDLIFTGLSGKQVAMAVKERNLMEKPEHCRDEM